MAMIRPHFSPFCLSSLIKGSSHGLSREGQVNLYSQFFSDGFSILF